MRSINAFRKPIKIKIELNAIPMPRKSLLTGNKPKLSIQIAAAPTRHNGKPKRI
jgi:hypothetical protein